MNTFNDPLSYGGVVITVAPSLTGLPAASIDDPTPVAEPTV